MDNFLGNSNQPGTSTIMIMVFNLDEYLALVHVLSCLYWKSHRLRSKEPQLRWQQSRNSKQSHSIGPAFQTIHYIVSFPCYPLNKL